MNDTYTDLYPITEEPDFYGWEHDRFVGFFQHVRENGGYSKVMSDIVWGKNRELLGKKYAKIPGLNMRELEPLHEAVYGDTPRRISCETALAKTAYTPFLWCHVVNAPYPEENESIKIGGGRLVHMYESEDTLYDGAWQIAEKTWISMPARALLDAAYYDCSNRVPDWLIMAVRIASFPSDEIIELAEGLDMQDAVRRICSIGFLLNKEETDTKTWLHDLAEYASSLTGENVWLDMAMPRNKIYWEDETFGVVWNIPPQSVRSYCYGPEA